MAHKMSDQAHPLRFRFADEGNYVAGAHESMREEARQAVNRHNAAIDLMTNSGDFAGEWDAPTVDEGGAPVLADNSAGPFQVAVDGICINLRGLALPADRPDAATMHRDVLAVATIDPTHPVARHWRVLADRCVAPGASLHWDDVASLVEG